MKPIKGQPGIEWKTIQSAITELFSCAFTASGWFVAMNDNGVVMRTNDLGKHWETIDTGIIHDWDSMVFCPSLNMLVAVAADGGGGQGVATSIDDGKTWLFPILPIDLNWSSVTFGNGTILIAGNAVLLKSIDGINFVQVNPPISKLWGPCAFGNNTFVVHSFDGTTGLSSIDNALTFQNYSLSPVKAGYSTMVFGHGIFLRANRGGSAVNQMLSSPTGLAGTWTFHDAPSYQAWTTIIDTGDLFVMIAENGGVTVQISTSIDGFAWILRTSTSPRLWTNMAFDGNVIIAIAGDGTIDNNLMISPVDKFAISKKC